MASKIKKRHTAQKQTKTLAPLPVPLSRQALEALQLVVGGARLLDEGSPQKAEKIWKRAVAMDPKCAAAWHLLTDFFDKNKRVDEAVDALRHWEATCERTVQNLWAVGNRSLILNQFKQARRVFEEALALDPNVKIAANLAIANADCAERDWEHAIRMANEVLDLDPDNLEALRVRYHCWYCLAWVPEEVADHRLTIKIRPNIERHSRLLFMINYLAETTPEQIYEESVHWSDLYAQPLAAEILPHRNTADPERRIKVAYISPDLKHHAIMKLLPAVFEKHDQDRFEIFAYSVDTKEDEFSDYVRRATQNFVSLPLNRKAVAERVRADGIDILVDLAGHTMHTDAYLAFATKPAPIQVSWLGILSTTGLRTMDYFIGDEYLPCPGSEHLFTEKVYRLPRPVAAYRPLGDPGIVSPPYFKNGYITFGCFNDPRKITQDVAKVWSILLHLHRDSKLMLKYAFLEREITQRRIRGWFADYGISMDRLIFEGKSKPLDYLARYGEIDIALDPFPYNGGTTTLDVLWMGVPIVSLCGRLPVACSGLSNISAIGLPVARTVEEYLAIANQIVREIPNIPNMRHNIRAAMMKSPLMDEIGLVRALEVAYRDMWRAWCREQQSTTERRRSA
jgi:tetratricopeptide (TPR) repeat protein